MNRRYEALLVLNAQGKDDSLREIIDRLASEFHKEGAQVEQVQKMDKRQFSYAAGALDSGYYVNFIFNAEPELMAKLRAKFGLDPEVYRQSYQCLPEKKEKAAKKLTKRK